MQNITGWLDDRFRIADNGSTVGREVTAGLTTFLATVYVVVVNPTILSETGMDFGAVFVATCLAAAFGTLVMGLVANYPVALAPGMGQTPSSPTRWCWPGARAGRRHWRWCSCPGWSSWC